MVLSEIRVPIQWCEPSVQQSYKIHRLSTLNYKLQHNRTFMALFAFAQATNVNSLPGTNHNLIQTGSSNDSFNKLKYVNPKNFNTNNSIDALENISNPFTADDDYLVTNLRYTMFSFISDTDSTLLVLDTEINRIILNNLRQFNVFHPCNENIKASKDPMFQSGEPVKPTHPSILRVDQLITSNPQT